MYLHRNHRILPAVVAVLRGAMLMPLAVLAAMLAAGAQAQALLPGAPPSSASDPGHFEVLAAAATLDNGVYFVDAVIEYRLSSEARNALQSGVPLNIRLDVEVLNQRRFWFDGEHAVLRQLYQLDYHALSERYIVLNVNSGDQASFASLNAALEHLGRIEHLPLIDAALVDDADDLDVRLRAVLDVEQFPGPLRLLAFWRRDWSLGSDWYRWPLRSD